MFSRIVPTQSWFRTYLNKRNQYFVKWPILEAIENPKKLPSRNLFKKSIKVEAMWQKD